MSGSGGRRHGGGGELASYITGYVLAVLLTCFAFSVGVWHWVTYGKALGVVFSLALVQVIVHFRFFLHIDLKRSARDDLQLILFSTLIILLMAGGTIIILFNLRHRMMM